MEENQQKQTTQQTQQQGDGDQTAGKENTPKTFTQEDVDRIVNERLKRASKPKDDKPQEDKPPKDNKTNPTDEKMTKTIYVKMKSSNSRIIY